MTPKEKAAELVVNNQLKVKSLGYEEAVKCAIITCDEVLGYMGADRGYQFWTEVKEELEKI